MPTGNERLSTELRATLSWGEHSVPVTVLWLAETGFYCQAHGIEKSSADLMLKVRLLPGDAAEWNPKAGGEEGFVLQASAELLYLDLPRGGADGATITGLGARFVDMNPATTARLRDYVATEVFRRGDWRTRSGPPARPNMATR